MKPGDLVEISFAESNVFALVVHISKTKKTWHRNFTVMTPDTGLYILSWKEKKRVKVINECG